MGFTFGGITSQQMGIKARLTDWQATPALRNSFVAIPGKPGVADFGATSSERTITIRCNVNPQPQFADLVAVLDGLAQWLNPDNGSQELILDDVPDRYYLGRLQDSIDCDRLIRNAGSFDLKFVCPDPFAYALVDETFTLTTSGSHTVTRVKGNADSQPIYLLKSTIPAGNSTYVSIATNGIELKVIGTLNAGEILVVDCEMMTAKITDANGVTLRNGLPLLAELNFPRLRTGTNTISITATGATFTELTIQAKSRWH